MATFEDQVIYIQAQN